MDVWRLGGGENREMNRAFLFAGAIGAATLALLTMTCLAQTKPVWSIYWLSDRFPCDRYWDKPMTSGTVALFQ